MGPAGTGPAPLMRLSVSRAEVVCETTMPSRCISSSSFTVLNDVLSFKGPGANLKPSITSFSWLDEFTLQINFETLTRSGDYSLVLGPNITNFQSVPQDNSFNGVPGEFADRYEIAF